MRLEYISQNRNFCGKKADIFTAYPGRMQINRYKNTLFGPSFANRAFLKDCVSQQLPDNLRDSYFTNLTGEEIKN